MPDHHHITLEDERLVAVSQDEASRLLYAMTSIAVTQLARWINVRSITAPDGTVLWRKADLQSSEAQK